MHADERRLERGGRMGHAMLNPLRISARDKLCRAALIGGSLLLIGCSDSKKKEPTLAERQDAALQDPYGYRPDVRRDVSGGGLTDYDKEGMRKDIHDVFNP